MVYSQLHQLLITIQTRNIGLDNTLSLSEVLLMKPQMEDSSRQLSHSLLLMSVILLQHWSLLSQLIQTIRLLRLNKPKHSLHIQSLRQSAQSPTLALLPTLAMVPLPLQKPLALKHPTKSSGMLTTIQLIRHRLSLLLQHQSHPTPQLLQEMKRLPLLISISLISILALMMHTLL